MPPLLKILRPAQWLKNLMLFFPPFLGGMIFLPGVAVKGLWPFAAFCLASSSTYIFNDILDREHDRKHPVKMNRPIASGQVSLPSAWLTLALCLATSIAVAFLNCADLLIWIIAYLAISVGYSYKLKHVPLVDVFCISIGFLIRLQAGGVAFDITISEWLFLSVFLLSLFLSSGKRMSEKLELGETGGSHRLTLGFYQGHFLMGLMLMTGSAVLVTYSMYVISRPALHYSVPLCAYGLFRYVYRVQKGKSGDPTTSLLKDVHLFVVSLAWAVYYLYVLY